MEFQQSVYIHSAGIDSKIVINTALQSFTVYERSYSAFFILDHEIRIFKKTFNRKIDFKKKYNIAITSLLLIVFLKITDTFEKYECPTVQYVVFSSHWFLIE